MARRATPAIRLHYLDEGPEAAAARCCCCTASRRWSYLYRTMVPPLVAAGHQRAWCPTWSASAGPTSRPTAATTPTPRHVEWMRAALFDRLDLRDVTLVGQDWGGLIGLRLVAEHPDRFRRVVAANTGLPDRRPSAHRRLRRWRRFSQEVARAARRRDRLGGHGDDARRRTSSPPTTRRSPTSRYKEGARQFPILVPASPTTRPPMPTGAPGRCSRLRPALPLARSATGTRSPAAPTGSSSRQRARCGRASRTPRSKAAGHFLQEDKGEELAAVVVDFIAHTPSG